MTKTHWEIESYKCERDAFGAAYQERIGTDEGLADWHRLVEVSPDGRRPIAYTEMIESVRLLLVLYESGMIEPWRDEHAA